MLRTATCVFIATAAMCVSNLAHAEDADYSREGCYLSLSGGVAIAEETERLDRESGALNARAGCRNEWAGGELHVEWLEAFGEVYTLDGKVYLLQVLHDFLPPVVRRFQPFATVGFGYLRMDGDGDFATRLGGGLDVYVTRNIVLSLDATYVLPTSDDFENLRYSSFGLGLLYRF